MKKQKQKPSLRREIREAKRRYAQHRRGAKIEADLTKIKSSSYCAVIPSFYKDITFTCVDCGIKQVWTAAQQKWWYEVAGGLIETTAIRCRPCRIKRRLIKDEARRVHLEGLKKKQQSSQN